MGKDRGLPKQVSEYTVIGVIDDGQELNRSVAAIRDLGVEPKDLTVVMKRRNPGEPEPFPEGTRYIVVPDDRRGLEVPLGFAIAFIIFGIFFAVTTPGIGIPSLVVFVSLAAILFAGSLTRVGVTPILTDMEAPREESESWNDQFELGRVLVFANTRDRRSLRPIREALQNGGASYYIVDRRLEPRAIHQAILYRAGARNLEDGSDGGSGGESILDRSGSA
ncbi:hypothetical protein BH24ACT22_BH24ACT22_18180 [soil metagenome]